MIQVRVVYYSFADLCGWTTWVRESDLNKWLEERKIPRSAWIWLNRTDRYDRYLGYEGETSCQEKQEIK